MPSNKTRYVFVAFLALLIFSGSRAGAQAIPINPKFGAVSNAELEMTVYPPDTSAAVVLLYRNVEVEATVSNTLGFARRITHTERVKILKESGKDYPDYKIQYRTNCEPREFVEGIKVVTYNLENGKKIVDKLPHKLIYDDEVSDTKREVSFSAKNVRVGSVVEVTFTYESPYVADIGTIFLQTTVPVNLSEASFSRAEYFHFNRMMRGFVPCTTNTSNSSSAIHMENGGRLEFNVVTDKHRAVDVPALKSAPHCYCPDLYRLGFSYELRHINIENLYYKEYNATWEQIDKDFRDGSFLKEFYAKSLFAGAADAIKASAEDEASLVSGVRKLVLDKVRLSEKINRRPSAAKALKSGEGGADEINALVASALNGVGFKADPVLLMTRSRGLLMNAHVSSDAYNALILRVTAPSGNVWFMDASDKNGYLNVLPVNYLVQHARVIPLRESASWVDLTRLARNQFIDNVAMHLAPDGGISGKRTEHGYNNWAATMKAAYHSSDNLEEFSERIENDDDIEAVDIVFTGAEDWSPDAVLEYSFTGQAETAGNLIYVRPFITKYQDESDFRDQERMIPVEFDYPETITYSATIVIPDGFIVESLPQPTMLNCSAAGSRAVMQCIFDGEKTISVNLRFNLNERLLTSEHYKELRDYWAHLCNLYDSKIVLKKI